MRVGTVAAAGAQIKADKHICTLKRRWRLTSRLGGHWNELWANRNMWNLQNDSIIAANRAIMTPEMLACKRSWWFFP